MTEQEWLECADPQLMLEFLHGKVSDRKLRLFAVACCRRVSSLCPARHYAKAIEVSNQFADDQVSRDELRQVYLEASRHDRPSILWGGHHYAAIAVVGTAYDAKFSAIEDGSLSQPTSFNSLQAIQVASDAATAWADHKADYHDYLNAIANQLFDAARIHPHRLASKAEAQGQASLLRDIFGNPFRPVPVSTNSLPSTVSALAQAIYDERAFDRLPILADALEEAGCTNQDVLNHCRESREHVRGCFAIDLVLGKE